MEPDDDMEDVMTLSPIKRRASSQPEWEQPRSIRPPKGYLIADEVVEEEDTGPNAPAELTIVDAFIDEVIDLEGEFRPPNREHTHGYESDEHSTHVAAGSNGLHYVAQDDIEILEELSYEYVLRGETSMPRYAATVTERGIYHAAHVVRR